MRLATIADGTLDGRLVVVSDDGEKLLVPQEAQCKTLLSALQTWPQSLQFLANATAQLETGNSTKILRACDCSLLAPLPRTFGFLDGSAFLEHVRLARQARGAELPVDLESIPLMYQGLSDHFLASGEEVNLTDPNFGLDFEAEFAVITTFVPRAISIQAAMSHVALIVILNDWTYRNLLPREASSGFGFIHSKPACSVAPFAVTPDQLSTNWRDARVCLDINVSLNGLRVGSANGDAMHFNFAQLIAHAAKTRDLGAGTIIGGGTVSNSDPSRGFSCIAEKRAREVIAEGNAITPFLNCGDVVDISAQHKGTAVFGKLRNSIT